VYDTVQYSLIELRYGKLLYRIIPYIHRAEIIVHLRLIHDLSSTNTYNPLFKGGIHSNFAYKYTWLNGISTPITPANAYIRLHLCFRCAPTRTYNRLQLHSPFAPTCTYTHVYIFSDMMNDIMHKSLGTIFFVWILSFFYKLTIQI